MIEQWQYEQYKTELNKVPSIPKGWAGKKQNNAYDKDINNLIYNTFDYNIFLDKLKTLNLLDKKDYYIKRWMVYLQEKCDRYLFSKYDCVEDNPNQKDQRYDFKIYGTELDLKSTRVSQELIEKYTNKKLYNLSDAQYKDAVMHFINSPDQLIQFLYENQSTGVRFSFHNRLFFVTADLTSKNNYYNEFKLRLDFNNKDIIINAFINSFNPNDLKTYSVYNSKSDKFELVKAKAIFFYKTEEGLFYSI